MSQYIHLADNLQIPAADAASQVFGIIAKRGMGKTNAAGVIIEDLSEAGVQCVVIDPTDAWWGLKSSADGKSAAYPFVIFGGNKADVPLEATAGKAVANFVVESGHSVILATRLLSKGQQVQLVADFCEAIYHLKGPHDKHTPLHVAIDEANLFVPQTVYADAARCVGAIQSLVLQGRLSGIGATLITQRPATIHKDVLTQVEVLIALQTQGTQDIKALKSWIETNADADKTEAFIKDLVKFQKGEAWVWSPSWLQILKRVKIRRKRTFDSSATPKLGAQLKGPKKLAKIDLTQVKEEIAQLIEKAKDNDPRVLQAKIRELKRELEKPGKTPAAAPSPEQLQQAADVAAEKARKSLLREIQTKLDKTSAQLTKHIQLELAELLSGPVLPAEEKPAKPKSRLRQIWEDAKPTPIEKVAGGPNRPFVANGCLTKGQRNILTVIVQHPEKADKSLMTVMTGYKRSSRDTYLKELRQAGYIAQFGSIFMATPAGAQALGDVEELPTGAALRSYWLRELPKGEGEILRHIIDAYPDVVGKDALSDLTGYKRSSRDTYLKGLRQRQLIQDTNSRAVKASDHLFED